jgi:diguanylate cyclase (GGDEF)-like protein/putative nucleotidyltransferase with HDIG domain
MSKWAWAYIWTIFVAALALTMVSLPAVPPSGAQWRLFVVLTVLATAAQMFRIEAPKEQTYFATPLFIFAGVLLLEPVFLVAMIVIAHLAEWAKERWLNSPLLRNWYSQPFNIAKHIIASLTALSLYWVLGPAGDLYLTGQAVVAVALSALSYVLLNQLILSCVLVLARGVSLRESGSLDGDNLLIEFVIASLGYSVTIAWQLNPWLVPLVLTPLGLFHRALAAHKLKVEAQTDAKTGLWNARHFATLFGSELDRAQRFNRPVAVIMADLDLLRNINNTYGHLAGDTVLSGIGQIIKKTIREYDIAARFGGEEFAIVLPEVTQDEARVLAERVRAAIEEATFNVATSATPLQATMSLGIACFPADGSTGNELIHAADVAVYQAKIQGRNRVVCSSDVSEVVLHEHDAVDNRLDAPYAVAFTPRPSSLSGITPANVAATAPVHSATELLRLNGELQQWNDELLVMLGNLLDTRDPFVRSHAGQVATYAVAIATELELPPERIRLIRQAALLHDVGKIVISERILYKPARLTSAEYEVVKKHAHIGGELLDRGQALRRLAPAVRHHHERWDGSGFPDGLQGPAIPLEARILNVCDSVEAMASDRPYKRAMTLAEIVAELKRCAGTQFDPGVVAALLRLLDRDGDPLIVNAALAVPYRQNDAAMPLSGDVWNLKDQPVMFA